MELITTIGVDAHSQVHVAAAVDSQGRVVIIYGLIGAMSTMYTEHIDPDVAFKALAGAEGAEDLFSWDNPVWIRAGVIAPSGSDSGSYNVRNSFQSRRGASRVLSDVMGLGVDGAE